jgi:tripartite-type tricarboxylate transporter receptor subunit TctC
VVDNKADANGSVCCGFVARSRPDGYTLLVTPNSTYAINPHLYSCAPPAQADPASSRSQSRKRVAAGLAAPRSGSTT